MKSILICFLLFFEFLTMNILASEITIFGLGEECRLFTYDKEQSIHDIWNTLQASEKMLLEKDLQNAYKYSRYVAVYRNGTIYVIDMYVCNNISFPLHEQDILLFSKTPFYHESHLGCIERLQSNLPPRCIYPINQETADEICNYLLEFISDPDTESPTTEYYLFYKKIAEMPSFKQYRFYDEKQIDVHLKNSERDLRYDDIILVILKTFPNWDKLYEIHLLSPCCVRMINKNTGDVFCYGLYKNELVQTKKYIHLYYNLHLTETSFQCSDILNHTLIKILISMEVYVGADERLISMCCINNELHVTIKTPYENEMYILKHNFTPRKSYQYGVKRHCVKKSCVNDID